MHCDTLKQDNDSTVQGDGGSRVGEVRAGTTSPMPEHKGFLATVTVRDPPIPTYGLGSVSIKCSKSVSVVSEHYAVLQYLTSSSITPMYEIVVYLPLFSL